MFRFYIEDQHTIMGHPSVSKLGEPRDRIGGNFHAIRAIRTEDIVTVRSPPLLTTAADRLCSYTLILTVVEMMS